MTAAEKPWIRVIGMGLDGAAGLSPAAQALIEDAEVVAGPDRLLAALDIAEEKRHVWGRPFCAGLDRVLSHRGRATVILATGDPMHFGVGATLARHVRAGEMTVIPAPSAFSLAAAALHWPLQNVACLSVHARPLEALIPHLQPGARILALTSNGEAPGEIHRLIEHNGFSPSHITVLENLGGPDERVRELPAPDATFAALNVVAIDCVCDEGHMPLSRLPGLPDAAFEHDGQITKREVRAVTVSAVSLRAGETLWDVGAGCGSVAIECLRAEPSANAIAFERHRDRTPMIKANARALGTPQLEIVAGSVPETLADRAPPDAIFLGGAVSDTTVFETCWQALKPGGNFVANAVTLEGEHALAERQKRLGGDLVRLEVSRATNVGKLRGMKPSMAVMQWRMRKP